ncbi:MAG: InlB B-repeat-containing protein [Oscillospiraceae bacterium]|nr:InlB B-repeat-containing protein [Oscillospiraceae bacterium]
MRESNQRKKGYWQKRRAIALVTMLVMLFSLTNIAAVFVAEAPYDEIPNEYVVDPGYDNAVKDEINDDDSLLLIEDADAKAAESLYTAYETVSIVPTNGAVTITVNFPGVEGVNVRYFATGFGWFNVAANVGNHYTFEVDGAHLGAITVISVNRGSMIYNHAISAADLAGHYIVNVPVRTITVTGINAVANLGVVNPGWVYGMSAANVGVANVFNVFDNGDPYAVIVGRSHFRPITMIPNAEGNLWIPTTVFVDIPIPEGVTNISLFNYGMGTRVTPEVRFNHAMGSYVINLFNNGTEGRLFFNFCCERYEIDFMLDGTNPFPTDLECWCCPGNIGHPCEPCPDCGECENCSDCLEFRWNMFNNGPGGYPSRVNNNIASVIRMWTGFGPLDGGNRYIPITAMNTITATLPNGECAMEFVRVSPIWNNQGFFNMIDVNRNAPWQRIYLTITVCGEDYGAILVNSRYFSLDIFNNGPEGTRPYFNQSLADAGLIRMWTRLGEMNADVSYTEMTAVFPDGTNAMEFIRVNEVDGLVRSIDAVQNNAWEFIYFSMTVHGQTVEMRLHNASYTPAATSHTVTFIIGEGGAAETREQPICDGMSITEMHLYPSGALSLETPLSGWRFVGWLPENPVGIFPTGSMEFTAIFEPDDTESVIPSVNVIFNAGDGTGTMVDEAVPTGGNFTLPANGFTAPDGYEFHGWFVTGYADPHGFLNPGDVIAVGTWPDTSVVVTAVWIQLIQMTTVNFDSGDGTGTMTSVDVANGSSFILPDNAFEAPLGYEFYAWWLSGYSDPLGTVAPGETIMVGNGPVTVLALWTPQLRDVFISYVLDNGDGEFTFWTDNPNEYGILRHYRVPVNTYFSLAHVADKNVIFADSENEYEFKGWAVFVQEGVGENMTFPYNPDYLDFDTSDRNGTVFIPMPTPPADFAQRSIFYGLENAIELMAIWVVAGAEESAAATPPPSLVAGGLPATGIESSVTLWSVLLILVALTTTIRIIMLKKDNIKKLFYK